MAEISTDGIGSKITMALKTGSGVDINELATSLSDAESLPQINFVTAKKASATVAISGYGILSNGVSALKVKLEALEDKGTFLTSSVSTSDVNAMAAEITAQSLATAGTTEIIAHVLAAREVTELKANGGAAFSSATATITGLNKVILTVNGGVATDVLVSNPTPQGIVDAINAANHEGITARTINKLSSGTAVSVLVESKTGVNNNFTISTNLSSELSQDETQAARDLKLTVNGMADIFRDNNSPSDVVDGVQLNIKTADDTTTRRVVVSSDTSALKTSIDGLITAYNDLITLTDYLTGDADPDDELAGSLSTDKRTVNLLLNKARAFLSIPSSSPTEKFNTFRDIGITIGVSGKLSLKETVFSAAVKTNFSDIRTMLTADTDDQLATSVSSKKGLALDANILLEMLISNTGVITTRKVSAQKSVTTYTDQLVDLQERLESSKQRYLMQFAAMETLVQRSKNTGDYLTGQFKAMESMYSN
jgi:flagellar hook-associated protein 2